MIRVENLKKKYGGHTVFEDLNVSVNDGEVVGIIGPSGTGKSFFLRSLIGLEKPDSGQIFIDEKELGRDSDATKNVGMVFQTFNLFEHLSVVENVMAGPKHVQGVKPEEAFDNAMSLLKTVGLADKAFAYPKTLSGGQKQRTAIARTLAMKPDIILLDEPTSELDPMMWGEVEAIIRMMAAAGHTMVIVTHEMELVRQICTRVLFFNDGVIYEEGTPEKIFDNPERTETRRFVRALRVLEFDVESSNFDFIGLQTVVSEFVFRNGVPNNLHVRLQSILEELFQMVMIQSNLDNKMHVSFEYNKIDKCLNGVAYFTGPLVDPDDPMYFFSWPIIVMRASEVTVEQSDREEFTNKVIIKIRSDM